MLRRLFYIFIPSVNSSKVTSNTFKISIILYKEGSTLLHSHSLTRCCVVFIFFANSCWFILFNFLIAFKFSPNVSIKLFYAKFNVFLLTYTKYSVIIVLQFTLGGFSNEKNEKILCSNFGRHDCMRMFPFHGLFLERYVQV